MKFLKAALLVIVVLLTFGRSSATAASILISAANTDVLTLDVAMNTNGLDLVSFELSFIVPLELAVTEVTVGSLIPTGRLSSTFFLFDGINPPVNVAPSADFSSLTSPFVVSGVLDAPSTFNGNGILFSIKLLASGAFTNQVLDIGPSSFGLSLIGANCDIAIPSPECDLGFRTTLNPLNGQKLTASLDVIMPASTTVPEPTMLVLVGSGLATAGWRRRRDARRADAGTIVTQKKMRLL